MSTPKSQPLKDPHGGLTAAGRRHYAEKDGAHLKPGVKKPESQMSVEEMRRKGSFLRRHYGRKKPFPLANEKGEPTRYALQAQAWGERLPRTEDDVAVLAEEGTRLLEKARAAGGKAPARAKRKPLPPRDAQ